MKPAKRERLSIILGGSFLGLLLFWQFVISPAESKVNKLETRILKREKDLEAISKLQTQYLELSKSIKTVREGLAARGKNFALFSFLERLAEESGVKGKVSQMKPREMMAGDFYKEVSIEIKLKEVTLKELIRYLHRIETKGRFLDIENLKIQPSSGSSGTLEVTFEVSTLVPIRRLALSVHSL